MEEMAGLIPTEFLFPQCHNLKYSTTCIRSYYFHYSTDGIYHVTGKSIYYHKDTEINDIPQHMCNKNKIILGNNDYKAAEDLH